jgi:hypothetical protein
MIWNSESDPSPGISICDKDTDEARPSGNQMDILPSVCRPDVRASEWKRSKTTFSNLIPPKAETEAKAHHNETPVFGTVHFCLRSAN